MLIYAQQKNLQAIRNPVRIRGGPAAVIGDGVEFQAFCRPLPGLIKDPGGKADSLRLIREPEDLPGGAYQATPDGKGSSIQGDGTLFLFGEQLVGSAH